MNNAVKLINFVHYIFLIFNFNGQGRWPILSFSALRSLIAVEICVGKRGVEGNAITPVTCKSPAAQSMHLLGLSDNDWKILVVFEKSHVNSGKPETICLYQLLCVFLKRDYPTSCLGNWRCLQSCNFVYVYMICAMLLINPVMTFLRDKNLSCSV